MKSPAKLIRKHQPLYSADLTDQAYSHLPLAILANVLLPLLLIAVLWGDVPYQTITVWLSCLWIITIARYVQFQKYRSSTNRTIKSWGYQFSLGVVLTGIVWGASGIFLFSDTSLPHQVFLTFVIGGLVAGATTSLASMQWLFRIFLCLLLLPIISRFFFLGGQIDIVMGIMLLLFAGMCIVMSSHIYKMLVLSIDLRYENKAEIEERKKVESELIRYKELLEETVEKRTSDLQKEIVERKQAEKELRENHIIFQAFLENSPVYIFFKDQDIRSLMLSRNYEQLLGMPLKNVLGKTMDDLFPSDLAKSMIEDDKLILSKGKNFTIVETFGERTYESTKFPIFIDQETKLLAGFTLDITDRKKAEEETKKFRTISDRAVHGIVIADLNGDIMYTNDYFARIHGFSPEEAMGQNLSIFHNENQMETVRETLNDLFEKGEFGPTEVRHLNQDGNEFPMLMSGVVIKDENGNLQYLAASAIDLTEYSKMEARIQQTHKLEAVGFLAGGIAHDFNNILVAILGNIHLALFDETLSQKSRSLLAQAEKASLRAKDLTQQLLTFSKGGNPIKETASLQHIIKDSANFILHGHNVTCQYNFPKDLWLVDVDKGQVSQVIQNIVLNARHAMPQGGTITIGCENVSSIDDKILPHEGDKKFVKISIMDNGIGIPQKLIDKIFDPYFSTKNEGSGLGLAICQSIVKKHKGNIFVESSPEKGTTFTLYFPASENQELLSNAKVEECEVPFKSKVLIMDDEEMVRNVAQAMLTQLGNEVLVSADGGEAVKIYREAMDTSHPIQLVIMDLTIPGGMGGEKAVTEIHKLDPNAKVIVSSGYSNDPIMANFREYGFCAAIVKPFLLEDLSKAISQIIIDDSLPES